MCAIWFRIKEIAQKGLGWEVRLALWDDRIVMSLKKLYPLVLSTWKYSFI